ncbi:unnamed protein product, partial [marine sediment metagenome]
VAREPFFSKFRKMCKQLYKEFREDSNNLSEDVEEIVNPLLKHCTKEDIKTILDIIPWQKFSSSMIPNVINNIETQIRKGNVLDITEIIQKIHTLIFSDFKKELDKIIKKCLNEKDAEFIGKKYEFLLSQLLKLAKERSFEEYRQKLGNFEEGVDQYLLEYISDMIDRNIYIIDINTGMPYKEAISKNIYKNRKTILILYNHQAGHYESLGRITNHEESSTIQRVFDFNDELIIKIHQHLN